MPSGIGVCRRVNVDVDGGVQRGSVQLPSVVIVQPVLTGVRLPIRLDVADGTTLYRCVDCTWNSSR